MSARPFRLRVRTITPARLPMKMRSIHTGNPDILSTVRLLAHSTIVSWNAAGRDLVDIAAPDFPLPFVGRTPYDCDGSFVLVMRVVVLVERKKSEIIETERTTLAIRICYVWRGEAAAVLVPVSLAHPAVVPCGLVGSRVAAKTTLFSDDLPERAAGVLETCYGFLGECEEGEDKKTEKVGVLYFHDCGVCGVWCNKKIKYLGKEWVYMHRVIGCDGTNFRNEEVT